MGQRIGPDQAADLSRRVEPAPQDEGRDPERRDERRGLEAPHGGDQADVEPDEGEDAGLDGLLEGLRSRLLDRAAAAWLTTIATRASTSRPSSGISGRSGAG